MPIEWISLESPVAKDIAEDGKSVDEVTPAQEAVLDEKDEEIKRLKEDVEGLKAEMDERAAVSPPPTSPAKVAFTEDEQTYEAAKADQPTVVPDPIPSATPPVVRQPKQPPRGDLGPGLGLSDMHARDRRDQSRVAKDLAEEPDIDEAEEKEYEKPISRDEQGRPVVENKDS